MTHPILRHTVVTEADRLPWFGSGSGGHVTPLRRFPFLVQITEFDLSEMRLLIGRATPLAIVCVMPADSAWIMLPLDGRERFTLCGQRAQANDIAMLGAGSPCEMALGRDSSWGALVVPFPQIDRLLSPPRHALIRRYGAAGLQRAHPETWRHAATLLRDAAFTAMQDPDAFRAAEAPRSLQNLLLEAFGELLARSLPPGPVPQRRPAPRGLREVVRSATETLSAQPDQVVRTTELAAAIGVSEHRLCADFEAVLGISAERYVRTRRLVLLRAALHSPARRFADSGEIALRFGYGTGRSLPRTYRRLFGEPLPQV